MNSLNKANNTRAGTCRARASFREKQVPTDVADSRAMKTEPPSMHTGDDDMAVAYGEAIKINVDNMRIDTSKASGCCGEDVSGGGVTTSKSK